MDNFSREYEMVNVPKIAGGRGRSDQVLQCRIFMDKNDNPHHILTDTREGDTDPDRYCCKK